MVTTGEVEQLLALGHELRSFEVKGPGDLGDRAFCAKVARAAMAMGNLRDGGLVCLGIDETTMTAMLPGLSPGQYTEWSDSDNVHDALARYCEPPVAFTVQPLDLSSGVNIVVLEVHEFDDVPHLCKRDYPTELQNGMAYVRPRGKPRSVPVPSATEMRELLDLATTKGVREFVRRAGEAGIVLGEARTVEDTEREAFDSEAAAAWANPSEVMAFILSSGHTDVVIRPGPFNPRRVSPARLEALLSENTVRMRGWPVPFVDNRAQILRHGTWIGQDIKPSVVPHVEAWRICASGQFLHRRVLTTDLVKDGQLRPDAPAATGAVAVWDILLYLVEVAEFSARLATTLENDTMTIGVSLNGIAGRQLISGDWARDLHGDYIVATDRLTAAESMNVAHLMQTPRAVGVALTQQILMQFGLDIPDQVLDEWQDQVFSRR